MQAETVVNKALTGTETKELIRRDFERMLGNFGELSDYMAFGRVGWKITLVLQTANAYRPTAESSIEGGEELPIDDAHTQATELQRQVESPNVERIRNDMPVPVKTKQLDGTIQTEYVKYKQDDVPDLPPEQVEIQDVTPQEAEKLEVKRRGRPRKL
jgi:hypothetical protein